MSKSGVLTVKVLGDARNFEKTMGSIGKTAATAFAAVGVAAAAGAVKAIGAFTKFEGQMNEVFTLLPGITQDAMDGMTSEVKNFSKEFGVLPDKVVPALYQALSAGVPKDNVFEFLETAQKAAKGGVTELATAVDGISSVVNAYGSDVVNAAQASDLMFTAVRLGKTNFEQLSASLSNVTPIASGLGVKFEDVAAALAAMTAKGTPTAQATTQLRQLFVELSKAGGKTAKTFEDIAGKSFQQFIAEGGNTADALDLMKQAADESGVQLQDLFGSVEAGAAALSLASGTGFEDALGEMGNAAGATDAAFDRMMQGLGPLIDKAKAFAAVLLIDIGQKLAPVIYAAMDRIRQGFALLSDWWAANGPTIMTQVYAVRDAIIGWINDVRPAIESWVINVLGSVTAWWSANGPTIVAAAESLRAGIAKAAEGMVRAVQFVVDQWDKFKVAIIAGAAIMAPHYAALAAAAVASSVKQIAAWVATQAAAIKSAVVHSAQVVAMIAKWALLAPTAVGYAALVVGAWVSTQAAAIQAAVVSAAQFAIQIAKWVALAAAATANAAVVAAAWLISMGPIVLVVAAVAGLAVAFVKNWDTIKSAVLTGVQFVVDKFLWFAEKIVGAAAAAFGWVPGVGEKLRGAEHAIAAFRDRANAELSAIRDRDILVTIQGRWNIPPPPIPRNISSRGGGLAGLYHAGGTFNAARPGGEGLVMLRDRERVVTPEAPSGPSVVTLDDRSVDRLARAMLQMARAN